MISEADIRLTLESFPLYSAEHQVTVARRKADKMLPRDAVLINYRTRPGSPWGVGGETTHFDLQIEGDTCYLVETLHSTLFREWYYLVECGV